MCLSATKSNLEPQIQKKRCLIYILIAIFSAHMKVNVAAIFDFLLFH